MNCYRLNHALTDIDDRWLDLVDRTTEEVQNMRQQTFRRKRLFRIALIAAAVMALMGITAYAVSSIHASRQQELRADLQIEENAVSGYTEYAEISPAADPASAESEPHIQLISSMQQGDYQIIYFSVSPVSEATAHSFVFENMETLFPIIVSNEEIPDDWWYTAGDIDSPAQKSSSLPVPYTEGHESEHMIEVNSQTGLPDENGVQSTVTFEVVDPEWINPLILEHSYDPETRSLMLMCGIYRKTVDFSRPVHFSVRCLEGASVATDTGTSVEEYIANYNPVYLEDFGTVTLEASDTEFISLPLTEPIRLVNPENNGNLEILDVRLSANCVEWKMTHDDIDLVHNLSPEAENFHDAFEKQLQWIRFHDTILSTAYLTFENGETFSLNASASAPYEDEVVTLSSIWSSTIDIGTVKSITVMGTEYEFPQISSAG